MSVKDVKAGFTRAAADGKITSSELNSIASGAGAIDFKEEKAFKEGMDQFAGMISPADAAAMRNHLGEIPMLRREAADVNAQVQRVAPALLAEVEQKLGPGPTLSYGGNPIPDAAKAMLNAEIARGVLLYDMRELKPDPVFDTSHGEPQMHIDGKYSPYAQEQRATDSMAFDFTELTPEKIQKDMTTTQTWDEFDGYTDATQKKAKFKTVTGIPKGGDIKALYDEASWEKTKARGPGGQKYTSNFAILADGSVHAVPASRRSAAEPWRILTNPSLARGKPMVFNGHIGMTNGVITYVGMSGRLCKLEDRGEAKFLDVIAFLKAKGFKLAPGLTVTREGGE
ncbi:MAG: hypothetical protein K1X89_14665 [Myxococcaceae bacterium]|nr:hypothetical protein [Myxococcaceae bacterium]